MDTALAIVGIVIGFYFGMRSVFQSIDMEALQRALCAESQATFNLFWRIATLTNRIGGGDDPVIQAKGTAREINEITIAARTHLVAFTREHIGFVPKYEVPWEPIQVGTLKRPKPFWRRVFLLHDPTHATTDNPPKSRDVPNAANKPAPE